MINKLLFATKYLIKNIKNKNLRSSNTIEYNINDLEDYVPQGICTINKYTLVSAYDNTIANNSKIFILNNQEVIKTVYIDGKYHVGGICYDNIHDNIWITSTKGCIECYKKDDIINAKQDEYIKPIYKDVCLGQDFINIFGNNRIAYITYYDNTIYVGNYSNDNKSIIKSFKINNDGTIDIDSQKVSSFIGYTQGLTFYKENNNTYLLVSTSCGRIGNSRLNIFNYNNEITDFNKIERKVLLLPSMMEQIIIQNKKLITLYEINAKKFNNKNKSKKDIIIYDIDDIL